MNISQLRKKVSELFKNGQLLEVGDRPKSPSKVIYNMKKDALQSTIDNKAIKWSDLGDVIFRCSAGTGNSPKAGEDSYKSNLKSQSSNNDANNSDESKANTETPSFNMNLAIKPEKNMPKKYVTTDGVVSINDIFDDLNLSKIFNNLDISLQSTFIKLAEHIKNNSGGGGDINITVPNKKTVVLKNEHLHPAFERVLFHVQNDKNVYLFGSAGAGKTTLAQQVAKSLSLDNFACYSCSAGMSEGLLTGRLLFDGTFFTTEFVEIWENGGLILLDEFDAIDGNLGVVLNSALANGILHVPNRKDKPVAKRHNDCYVIGAGNTDGTGNGGRIYAGRNKLDGATLDRFTQIKFDYDKKLEKKLSGGHNALYKSLNVLRKNVDKYEINRVVSTRAYLKLSTWMSGGKTLEYCLNTLTESWSEFERTKAEVSSIIKAHTI